MKMEVFEMERMMSTWENVVEYDISESGVEPITLRELIDFGFDLDSLMDMTLGNCQGNGTIELRDALTKLYPGATPDHIEVTNGTSEANYLLGITLLKPGDEFAIAIPNYMQLKGIARAAGATVNMFHLRQESGWDVDWDEFDQAVTPNTRLVYFTRPGNPTGAVLSDESVRRVLERCEEMDAYVIFDEVYIGSEIDGSRTRTCWGLSDKVIVVCGLSKSYGIPGIRIGWLVGPRDVVAECWAQHDYITVGPNKISDAMARTAVDMKVREKLFLRIQNRIRSNLPIYREWVAGFDGFLELEEPAAGAFCFVKYHADTPSIDIADSLLKNQSTLIAPGAHFGTDGYLRIWAGGETGFIREGLERFRIELDKVRKMPA
jgi:aspartate/methionine/tyrosine aminotransferase